MWIDAQNNSAVQMKNVRFLRDLQVFGEKFFGKFPRRERKCAIAK